MSGGRDKWLITRTAENILANIDMPGIAERRVRFTNDDVMGLWIKWLEFTYTHEALLRSTLVEWRRMANRFIAEEIARPVRVVVDDEWVGAEGLPHDE